MRALVQTLTNAVVEEQQRTRGSRTRRWFRRDPLSGWQYVLRTFDEPFWTEIRIVVGDPLWDSAPTPLPPGQEFVQRTAEMYELVKSASADRTTRYAMQSHEKWMFPIPVQYRPPPILDPASCSPVLIAAHAILSALKLGEWSIMIDIVEQGNRNEDPDGFCNRSTQTISISPFSFEGWTPTDEVVETILHEIAHALDDTASAHGPAWMRWYRLIGGLGGEMSEYFTSPMHSRLGVCPQCGLRDFATVGERWFCENCGYRSEIVKPHEDIVERFSRIESTAMPLRQFRDEAMTTRASKRIFAR